MEHLNENTGTTPSECPFTSTQPLALYNGSDAVSLAECLDANELELHRISIICILLRTATVISKFNDNIKT